MLIKQIVISISLFFVILFTNDIQADVSVNDLVNLNENFQEFITSTGGEESPYRKMSLPLYALEFDHFEMFFYLAKREGFQFRYVSPLQEPNVTTTTIFHTAIRKCNAALLDRLLNEFEVWSPSYEYSSYNNRAKESTNIMGLALLPEYVNYNIIKTILDHKFNANGKNINGSDRYKNVDVRVRPYWSTTTTYQAFMLDRLDIVELLLQYGAGVDPRLLNEYIIRQNKEGVRLTITYGAKVMWSHIELALKYNTNPEGREIALLLFEVYDQTQSP
jgi:hypothetical protein